VKCPPPEEERPPRSLTRSFVFPFFSCCSQPSFYSHINNHVAEANQQGKTGAVIFVSLVKAAASNTCSTGTAGPCSTPEGRGCVDWVSRDHCQCSRVHRIASIENANCPRPDQLMRELLASKLGLMLSDLTVCCYARFEFDPIKFPRVSRPFSIF
jgi:hypothetical protein